MFCIAWMSSALLYWVVILFLARLVEWKCYSYNRKARSYHWSRQLFIQGHGSGNLSVVLNVWSCNYATLLPFQTCYLKDFDEERLGTKTSKELRTKNVDISERMTAYRLLPSVSPGADDISWCLKGFSEEELHRVGEERESIKLVGLSEQKFHSFIIQ